MRVIWTALALGDLDAFFDFLQTESPSSIEHVFEQILTATKPLDDHPYSGSEIRGLPGRYKVVVRKTKYLIIYRVEPEHDRLLVTRVIHSRRPWQKMLRKGS